MAVSPADATSVSEPLYKEEFARYGRNGGITAVPFYDGEAVAAAAYAKGKLREVLEANPWIAGQLVKQALVHLKAGVCIVPKAAFGASEGGPQTQPTAQRKLPCEVVVDVELRTG